MNQQEYDDLRAAGYSGALNEMKRDAFVAAGSTIPTLDDSTRQWLISQGHSGTNIEMWYAHCRSLGFTGSFNDVMYQSSVYSTIGGGSDPFWDNVVLLMSSATTDQSSYARTITPGTSAPTTDTVVYQYAPSSVKVTTRGELVTAADAAELKWGTQPFIIEVFAKCPDAAFQNYAEFYAKWPENNSGGLQLTLDQQFAKFRSNGTNTLSVDLGVNNNFKYVAFIRDAVGRRIYYAATPGGTATQVASDTVQPNVTATGLLRLFGSSSDPSFTFRGNMHIRVTVGTTRGVTGGASYVSPTEFVVG